MTAFISMCVPGLAAGSAACLTVITCCAFVWDDLTTNGSSLGVPAFLVFELALVLFFRCAKRPISFAQNRRLREVKCVATVAKYCRAACTMVWVLSLLATLIRTWNPITCLSWSALYFLLGRTLRTNPLEGTPQLSSDDLAKRKPWFRAKSVLINAGLLSFSVLFCLAFLEIAARFVAPEYRPRMTSHMYDPTYLFLPRPHATFIHKVRTAESRWEELQFHVSSLGFRDREYGPKEPGEYRILMLGDSFTMGHATPRDEDTIPKMLESILTGDKTRLPGRPSKVSVINAGCGGGGPIQELGMLERGLPLEPDLAVLQLLPQNDIENCLELVGKCQRAYDPNWQNSLSRFRRQSTLPYRAEAFVRDHSGLYRFVVTGLLNNRNVVALLLGEIRLLPAANRPESLPPREDRPFFLEVNLKQWYPELDEGLDILKDYVNRIAKRCSESGIDFVVYTIPDYNEINDGSWAHFQEAYRGRAEYVRLKGVRKISEFLADENIPHFTVYGPLKAYGNPDEVYHRFDGHFTELGNRIAAQTIARFLCDDYFARKKAVVRQ